MRKKLAAALLAAFLLSAGAARADNLYISGLGTLPFDWDIAVTDGAGTAVEGMIRRQASAPQERNTKRNRLMRFLTVPGGMTLADGTAHSPAAGARLWQLVKKETHGTYTMLAVAFSGDGDELFPKGGQKARERLETVFRTGRLPAEEKDRVLISLDEFRDAAAKAVAGKTRSESMMIICLVHFILSATSLNLYTDRNSIVRDFGKAGLYMQSLSLFPYLIFYIAITEGRYQRGMVMQDTELSGDSRKRHSIHHLSEKMRLGRRDSKVYSSFVIHLLPPYAGRHFLAAARRASPFLMASSIVPTFRKACSGR